MKKSEIIERYGEAEYARRLERGRAYYKEHPEEEKAYREAHREKAKVRAKRYREEHPEVVIVSNHEHDRRGGKYYETKSEYDRTGLRGERNKIRMKHANNYRPFKNIIAPESQIHHEWVPDTSEYRGVALVEADAHQYGIIDVIEILDGKITLLTEEEVKKGGKREKESL